MWYSMSDTITAVTSGFSIHESSFSSVSRLSSAYFVSPQLFSGVSCESVQLRVGFQERRSFVRTGLPLQFTLEQHKTSGDELGLALNIQADSEPNCSCRNAGSALHVFQFNLGLVRTLLYTLFWEQKSATYIPEYLLT